MQTAALTVSDFRIELRIQDVLSSQLDGFHIRAGRAVSLNVDLEIPAERTDILHGERTVACRCCRCRRRNAGDPGILDDPDLKTRQVGIVVAGRTSLKADSAFDRNARLCN